MVRRTVKPIVSVICSILALVTACHPVPPDSGSSTTSAKSTSSVSGFFSTGSTHSTSIGTVGTTRAQDTGTSKSTKKTATMEDSDLWEQNYSKYLLPLLKNEQPAYIKSGFSNFITRKGNKLYDGDKEIRFLGMNCVGLPYNTDDCSKIVSTENRRRNSPYEIRDAVKSIVQSGCTVTRLFVMTCRRSGEYDDGKVRLLYAPGVYDELLWRDLDRVLAELNLYGIRAIMTLIDSWGFLGGMPQFDRLCGGPGTLESFYTRQDTINKFKQFIYDLVNRINYYTGVKYKDDKAIMCWELGNEITSTNQTFNAPSDWQIDIARYIKSIDPNHLIMDGGGIWYPTDEVIQSPYIDIITYHYHDPYSVPGKPTVMGEFNPNYISQKFIDDVMAKSVGMLFWTLVSHNKNGGFLYRKQDWGTGGTVPIRWPGFATGIPDEAAKLSLYSKNAYRIQGKTPPPITPPDPPVLLPIFSVTQIRWRGSAGADCYDLQRAENPNGPYVTIKKNLDDSAVPSFIPYYDKTADSQKVYYYRLIAKNRAGNSKPSNIIPYMPEGLYVDMEEETYGNQFVDEFNSLKRTFLKKGIVNQASGMFEDSSTVTVSSDSELVYKINGKITDYFLSLCFVGKAYENLEIYLSEDGKSYTKSNPRLIDFGPRSGSIHCARLVQYQISGNYSYLKIKIDYTKGLENSLYIGRLELNYR